jgi:hypothetical protein
MKKNCNAMIRWVIIVFSLKTSACFFSLAPPIFNKYLSQSAVLVLLIIAAALAKKCRKYNQMKVNYLADIHFLLPFLLQYLPKNDNSPMHL